MDIYLQVSPILTPQMIATLIGVIIGACLNADIKSYGWRVTILMTILTLAFGATVTEYLQVTNDRISVFAYFLLGGFIGLVGLSLLDAIRLFMPQMAKDLVHAIGDVAIKSTKELIIELFEVIKANIRLLKIKKGKNDGKQK